MRKRAVFRADFPASSNVLRNRLETAKAAWPTGLLAGFAAAGAAWIKGLSLLPDRGLKDLGALHQAELQVPFDD
jgi:hypothetical protein